MSIHKVFFYGVLLFILGDFLSLNKVLEEMLIYSVLALGLILSLLGVCASKYQKIILYSGLVIFLLGVGLFVGNNANKLTSNNIKYFMGQKGIVTGKVVHNSWRNKDDGVATFLLDTSSFLVKEQNFATSGKLKVTLYKIPEGEKIASGSTVSVSGKILPIRTFSNPSNINLVEHNARQDIYGRLVAKHKLVAVDRNLQEGLQTKVDNFLQLTKENMQKSMSTKDQILIYSMLFGGYDGIDAQLVKDFSTTGLVHILSVSGTHVAIIAGFILWFASLFKISRRKAAVLATVTIVVYGCLSGFLLPVVRSVIMGIAVLLGYALGRKSQTGNVLGFICILMLIYEPRWLFDISFQLSFLATAGLVFLYPKIKEKLAFLPEYLSTGLAITIAVQMAVLPFIANYFYQVSLVAFLANLIVLPIIEFCLIISLFGLVIFFFIPMVGKVVFIISSLFLGVAIRLTAFLADFSWATITIPAMPDWFWICYYIIVFIYFDLLPTSFTKTVKRISCVSILIVMIICSAVIFYFNRDFAVHFIDVGQGDACLIITPKRNAILIDTGARNDYTDHDVGEKVIVPYLKHYGIKQIHLLVISHGDNDHAGGAANIVKKVPVKNIWLPNEPASDDIDRLLFNIKESNVSVAKNGLLENIDGVDIEVIYSENLGYIPKKKKNNEMSTIVKVSYKGKSFLFTGDATASIERAALPMLDKVSVLKVSHHGSASSTDSLFLAKINPDLAVISVAANNIYGHPKEQTLKRLKKQGSKIVRTDEQGAILIKIKNDNLIWYSYKENPKAF